MADDLSPEDEMLIDEMKESQKRSEKKLKEINHTMGGINQKLERMNQMLNIISSNFKAQLLDEMPHSGNSIILGFNNKGTNYGLVEEVLVAKDKEFIDDTHRVDEKMELDTYGIKMDFPEFNGDNPRTWLKKVNSYFTHYPKDEFAKVRHASYYLTGEADLWYIENLEGKQPVTWDYFSNLLLEHFSVTEIDDGDVLQNVYANSSIEVFDVNGRNSVGEKVERKGEESSEAESKEEATSDIVDAKLTKEGDYNVDTINAIRVDVAAPGEVVGVTKENEDAHNNQEADIGEDLSNYYLSEVYILDTDSLVWRKLNATGQLLPPRSGQATVNFGKNMFVFGGFSDEQNLYDDVHVLDIKKSAWTKVVAAGEGPSGRFSMAGESLELQRAGLCREVERDEWHTEILSLRKRLKLECQEQHVISRHILYSLELDGSRITNCHSVSVTNSLPAVERPWKVAEARLVLEDGSVWRAKSFVASGTQVDEVVFNTSLAGYLEIITYPSYADQFVLMTNPLIGNTVVNFDDAGLVIKSLSISTSNWRCTETLGDYLASRNIMGIYDVDTHAITRRWIQDGSLIGVLTTEESKTDEELLEMSRSWDIDEVDLISGVSCTVPYEFVDKTNEEWDFNSNARNEDTFRVVACDFGIKQNGFNSVVVLTAVGVHWIMAPNEDLHKIVKPLLFLLRSSNSSKYVVLCNIQVFDKIITWMDENVLPTHGFEITLRMVVQTLQNIGSKSFTHLITVPEQYRQVISRICPDQNKQAMLITEISSSWKNNAQMTAIAIDQMMGYRLISNLTIVKWVFSPENVNEFHISDRSWEILENAVRKTFNRITDLRKEISSLKKNVIYSTEAAFKAQVELDEAKSKDKKELSGDNQRCHGNQETLKGKSAELEIMEARMLANYSIRIWDPGGGDVGEVDGALTTIFPHS